MKSSDLLSTEQQAAVTHIYETGESYLIGQMGSGKTVVALTAAAELLRAGEVSRVLVVAPPRVVNDVWRHECAGWAHLHNLDVGIATGAPAVRLNVLNSAAAVVVVTFDCLPWLFDVLGKDHHFDMLIVDEVTKLKAGGKSFKALRKMLPAFIVRVVMTGTPVAESWADLFYCVMAADGGARFGRNKQAFFDQYYYPLDYERRKWAIRPDCINEVTRMLRDLVVVLPDYTHELPPLEEVPVHIRLPEDVQAYYDAFERDMLNDKAAAVNAAVLTGKLQQIASGFLYPDEDLDRSGDAVQVHHLKTAEAIDLGAGAPTVYVYQFKEELARLTAALPNARRLGVSDKADRETLALWRSGELDALFIHPKSAAHGLDLTAGSNMVILSPIWSRDQMRQVVARIWRRNQTKTCTVWILCALKTIDVDIILREQGKSAPHEVLMSRLAEKVNTWRDA